MRSLPAVVMVLLLTVAACEEVAAPRVVERERPQVFDVRSGTFRGVQAGDPIREVRRRLGRTRCRDFISPLGERPRDIGEPRIADFDDPDQGERPFRSCVLRYRGLVAWASPSKGVFLLATTSPRAESDRGVGVGDPIEIVKQRYPRARCHPHEVGDEHTQGGGCTVEYGRWSDDPEPQPRGVLLTFGIDPEGKTVRSIWLNATTPRAIRRLRSR